jgi:glycine cleavage system H protein
MTPEDRKYARTHEWIKIESDGRATVGISDHAQESLGDITFIELPEVGHDLQPEEECGVIESVKAASDIYAPIGGKVAEVNDILTDRPEVVNEDCYGAGWIFKLDGIDETQLEDLLDAPEYEGTIDDDDV